MLKNDNINRVLAVVVAIVLWAYVVGEVNPVIDKVIHNVPISFEHQDALERNNLTILSSSTEKVNISVSGQRATVSKLNASDFNVTCDVEGLTLGENVVRLKVEGPNDAKIEHINTEKVTVIIDEKTTAEKPVQVVIQGETSSDKEASVVKLDTNKIAVSGPKTSVNKVVSVAAYLDASDVTTTTKSFTVKPVPIDASGKQVDGVYAVGDAKVGVDAVLLTTKTVSLHVDVTNDSYGGIERSYSVPKTIVIKGTEDALRGVSLIKCQTVDLKNVLEDTAVELKPILPTGIQVAEASKNLSLSITVKDTIKRTFEFTNDDINLQGKNDDLMYTLGSAKHTIEVTGNSLVVDSLSLSDFVITINVSEMEKGNHTAAINVTCNKEIKILAVMPEKIEIHIS